MSVEINGKRYSWNASICLSCWNQRNPDRLGKPEVGTQKYISGEVERCTYCGGGHVSGIYVRDDPRQVPFPRLDIEDDPSEPVLLELSEALKQELFGD